MKKVISYAMAAAVTLGFAACSNDEVVEQAPAQGGAIGFSTFVDNASRADLTSSNITSFTVWGGEKAEPGTGNYTKLFNGVAVSLDGSDWTYESSSEPLRYWNLGWNYWFAAIAGENYVYTPNWSAWYDNGNGTLKFDQTAAQGQVDLCYAWRYYSNVTDGDATPRVGLTFNHMLSRVTFTFENQMLDSQITLMITDVSFNETPDGSDATLTFDNLGTPAWSGATPKDTNQLPTTISGEQMYNNVGPDPLNPFLTSVTSEPLYIIPRTAAADDYSVGFVITRYDNGVEMQTFTHLVNLPAVNYELGKSYNLRAVINESNIADTSLKPIKFTVTTVSDWTPEGTTDIPGWVAVP